MYIPTYIGTVNLLYVNLVFGARSGLSRMIHPARAAIVNDRTLLSIHNIHVE